MVGREAALEIREEPNSTDRSTRRLPALRGAVQDRDRNLRLNLDHNDEGEAFVHAVARHGPLLCG